jgi:hypothetical protein
VINITWLPRLGVYNGVQERRDKKRQLLSGVLQLLNGIALDVWMQIVRFKTLDSAGNITPVDRP